MSLEPEFFTALDYVTEGRPLLQPTQFPDYLREDSELPRYGLYELARQYAYRLRYAWRNAVGRFESTPRVTLQALPLQKCPDGRLAVQPRDVARIEGIEAILAKFPWADKNDLRMFLMGFDRGEQWVSGSADSEKRTQS